MGIADLESARKRFIVPARSVSSEPTRPSERPLAAIYIENPRSDSALFSFLEEHALQALASRSKTDDLIGKLRYLHSRCAQAG